VVADHSVGLFTPQFPNGQPPALLVDADKRVDKIDGAFLVDDGVKRVRGAEGVPEREDGVLIGFWILDFRFWIWAVPLAERKSYAFPARP